MASQPQASTFFRSPYFAVVGASTDPSKFGHKIFAWYLDHSLPATPINPSPSTTSILSVPTLPNISALPHPAETGISIITPPKITIKVLEEAKKLGVKSVWLQPGTFDAEVEERVREWFPEGGVVGGGACVLVDGDWAMEGRGKL